MTKSKNETTVEKYSQLLTIYKRVVKESGKYAPYLAKSYFVTNTVHEAVSMGISAVSRSVVYEALKWEKQKEIKKQVKLLEASSK